MVAALRLQADRLLAAGRVRQAFRLYRLASWIEQY